MLCLAPPDVGGTYELYPGIGYYKLHTNSVAWEEAREICESEGAHLAIINSDEEAAAIRKLISKYPNTGDWIYIGFHDQYVEGQYVTVLGKFFRYHHHHYQGVLPKDRSFTENAGT